MPYAKGKYIGYGERHAPLEHVVECDMRPGYVVALNEQQLGNLDLLCTIKTRYPYVKIIKYEKLKS